MSRELFSPLALRSGGMLRSGIAKAAMEENMAGGAQLPDDRLISLYGRWGEGGAGLLVTGNRLVHAEAPARPRRRGARRRRSVRALRALGRGREGGRRHDMDADQPPRPPGAGAHARR